jgi:hypothetical protein
VRKNGDVPARQNAAQLIFGGQKRDGNMILQSLGSEDKIQLENSFNKKERENLIITNFFLFKSARRGIPKIL